MKLYLVQHAEAVSKDLDKDRPLSAKGLQDVESLVNFLQSSGVQVSNIFHSGKTRARQTAELLSPLIQFNRQPQVLAGLSAKDDVEVFVRDSLTWQEDTMLVGHLPFMARLVSLLVCGEPQREVVSFQPGTIVTLDQVSEGDQPDWQMTFMLQPGLLSNELMQVSIRV